MKKLVACACVYLVIAFSFKAVSAGESGSINDEARVENYIASVYRQIDFSKCDTLSYDVFDKAFHGYLNLRNAGKLNNAKHMISVCDFSLPSAEKRLWIIDLAQNKVVFNTYVAHGMGSGTDIAETFSNNFETHQSSLGFYVTGDTYNGDHGTSLHLAGMDQGFNDAAFERGIVVHGAKYVSEQFINAHEHCLGRSWGCPAVAEKLAQPIINAIKDGTCLFIYSPDKRYLKNAYWVNKKVSSLPENDIYADAISAAVTSTAPKTKTMEYWSDSKLDSVKVVPAK